MTPLAIVTIVVVGWYVLVHCFEWKSREFLLLAFFLFAIWCLISSGEAPYEPGWTPL